MNRSTISGLLAILFWSSTVAFSWSISEPLGPMTAGAVNYTLGGILATVFSYFTPLLSTLVPVLILQVQPSRMLGLGAFLITAGAVMSRLGIRDGWPGISCSLWIHSLLQREYPFWCGSYFLPPALEENHPCIKWN